MQIDLNCDLGEGCGSDADLMPLVSSANISCGFHAGDAETAFAALVLAGRHGVAAGAHPGFADRDNFGRRELTLSADEVHRLCLYQVGALQGLASEARTPLRFLKPHGALYNMACRKSDLAQAVVAAAVSLKLPLVGLPGSALAAACAGKVPFIAEGFADRRYLPDGSLVPRTRADAYVESAEEAVAQARRLVEERGIQTLCVHGDNPQAITLVRQLRQALLQEGYQIRACA